MSTLKEIQAKIAELEKQANELINQEKAGVIADIKAKIDTYKLTAVDLGLNVTQVAVKAVVNKPAPKYRHPSTNETWHGGRGAKPNWVKAFIADGGDIETCRIPE